MSDYSYFHNVAPPRHECLSVLFEELGECCSEAAILVKFCTKDSPVSHSLRQPLAKELGDLIFAINWVLSKDELGRHLPPRTCAEIIMGVIGKLIADREANIDPRVSGLCIFMELAGEAIRLLGKVFRHGLESEHPSTHVVNSDVLARILLAVGYAIGNLAKIDLVDQDLIDESQAKKRLQIVPYLHHNATA